MQSEKHHKAYEVQRILKKPQYFVTSLKALDERKIKIQRSQTIHGIEQRIIEQRGRLLLAQQEIIDINKTLIEIKSRLHELSNL